MRDMIGERRKSDREVFLDEMHAEGNMHFNRREVPNSLDARVDQAAGDALRKLRGNSDRTDLYVPLLDNGFEFVDGADLEMVDRLSHFLGILVKERNEVKAKGQDVLVVCKRNAEMPHSDDRDVPMAVETQNLADIVFQLVDKVADAFFAELPKGSKVLSNLFGRNAEASSKLFG